MNDLSELKAAFLREHVRDRRLILINYTIILSVIGLIIGLLAYIGVDFMGLFTDIIGGIAGIGTAVSNESASTGETVTTIYPIVATIAAFVGVCGYPFYQIWRLSRRPRKIDELIARAEKGAKLGGVNDHVEYKITLPLLKINIKLCPVMYVHILMDNDIKPYVLPIRRAAVADMKIMLSGVDIKELNKQKEELYGDVDESLNGAAEDFVATPLKTVDEFRTFIDTELKDDIESLEKSRKSGRMIMVMGSIIVGIVIVGVMGYIIYNSLAKTLAGDYSFDPLTTILPIFLLIMVITAGVHIVMKKKYARQKAAGHDVMQEGFSANTFKEKIIARMVEFINPSAKYIPMGHLSLGDVFESGLFQEHNYMVDGSDQISGKHNGVPFIMCDLSLKYKRNFSDEKDEPDSVFYGQFFVARFNKRFNSPVYVYMPTSGSSYLTADKGEQVKLEDPEFMKMFRVYAQDQVEARYILTPSLMERLKEMAKRTKGKYLVAFYNNKITVANNSNINNFEAGYSKSLTKKENELLTGFYTDLYNQFSIIDDLKLNINIWKKS